MPLSFLMHFSNEGIKVYKKSKSFINQRYMHEIDKLSWAYHSIGSLIPQTTSNFWSGHFFPFAESQYELGVSFSLCMMGFYKQAMVSLRSTLELGLLSVYWNLNDDGYRILRKWLSSNKFTPRFQDVWQSLVKHRNFCFFQKYYDLSTHIESVQRYLHRFVHTRGYKFSNSMGIFKSMFPTFEKKAFEIWFNTFQEVVKVIVITHLVRYPLGTVRYPYYKKFGICKPRFGGLDEWEVDRLEDVVGSRIFNIIEKIASQDVYVQDKLSWVESLPDMTEDDMERQIIEFDKMQIQGMGFDKWMETEEKLHEQYGNNDTRWLQRLRYLEQWAKEHGY